MYWVQSNMPGNGKLFNAIRFIPTAINDTGFESDFFLLNVLLNINNKICIHRFELVSF